MNDWFYFLGPKGLRLFFLMQTSHMFSSFLDQKETFNMFLRPFGAMGTWIWWQMALDRLFKCDEMNCCESQEWTEITNFTKNELYYLDLNRPLCSRHGLWCEASRRGQNRWKDISRGKCEEWPIARCAYWGDQSLEEWKRNNHWGGGALPWRPHISPRLLKRAFL